MSKCGHSGPAAPLRVLVVEDEMLVALMLEEMLAELGHEVAATVADFDHAMAIARSGAFDVAILDVNLNGTLIYPVADALAARGIPFAFSTGYGQRNLHECHRARPTLPKPFERRELENLMAEMLPSLRC